MRRLLARLLGSTSDPALAEAVARLAAAQRDTNELLGEALGVLREVDAGLGRVTCWQPVQAEELRGLLDRQHVDIVTLNALLGSIRNALERAPVDPAPPVPGAAPASAVAVGDGGERDLTSHDRAPCSSGGAQQPEPKAAPEAPAAPLSDDLGQTEGVPELPPPPASEEVGASPSAPAEPAKTPAVVAPAAPPTLSMKPLSPTQSKLYRALFALANETDTLPKQKEIARGAGIPIGSYAMTLSDLERKGCVRVGGEPRLRSITIVASGKVLRPAAAPASAPSAEVVPIRPAPPVAAHVDAQPVIPDGPRAYVPPSDRVDAMRALKARGHKVIPMSGGRFFHNGETIDGAELIRRAKEAGAA
jgi:hypothetical protein